MEGAESSRTSDLLTDRGPSRAPREVSNARALGDRGRTRCGLNGRPGSADLFRPHDDDALRAADVAEPVTAFVALHLAEELRAAGLQPGDGGVDVVDGEGET